MVVAPSRATPDRGARDMSEDRNGRRARAAAVLRDVLVVVEPMHPALAADGRHALRQLMPAPPGRPPKRGRGAWKYPETLARTVRRIVARRDTEAVETLIAVEQTILALAHRLARPRDLTETQQAQLRTRARKATASEITRTLLSVRFDLPDRTIRDLLKHPEIQKARWG